MKLVTQIVLVFVEGRTEKVYEVDLCEVGAGRFVVNFRYGKKGAALKDGSKTVAPVSRAEADRVFQKLVSAKEEQGYVREAEAEAARVRAQGAAARATASGPARPAGRVANPAADAARARILLERLGQAGADRRWFRRAGATRSWPLERAIWRAGEVRLREAEPLLLALLHTASSSDVAGGGKGVRDYSIAWALGRLGGEASIESLARMRADPKQPGHVQRIATEALLALSDAETRADFRRDIVATLPAPLRDAHAAGVAADFAGALEAHLAADPRAFAVMDLLYLVDDEVVRPAFLAELARAPLNQPHFYWLRHLFKAAEYRRDPRVFGLFAARFEKVRANPVVWRATPKSVYAAPTREYLRRRSWRTLRRMGELADPEFVPLAAGVLLAFTDADAVAPRGDYDTLAPYRVLNHLLFTNSPRYELRRNTKAFRLRRGQRAGQPAPPAREEAFPALWEARPEGLMQLVAESTCTPVVEFAARALVACGPFLASLDDDDVALVLTRPYAAAARLGLELARSRHASGALSAKVLGALASCAHEPARRQAFAWIDERRAALAADTSFLAALITARHADARGYARTWVRSLALAPETGAALVGRVIAALLALPDDAPSAEVALDAAQTLSAALGKHLGQVGPAALRDLLGHPLAGVQEVGAELLSRLDSRSGLVPVDVVLMVVRSPFANVRAVGMRLLAELPDDALTLNFKLLVHLTADANADLRHASRPLVARVARAHPEIGLAIAEGLVEALLRRKLAEGAPSHVLRVLKEDLTEVTAQLTRETVWRLLRSGSPHAQELGGLLLADLAGSAASELELEDLVELGSHDVLAVRQASWRMFEAERARVLASLVTAARLCDAKWADTRERAFAFFRAVPAEHFTADVLVSVIDSVKEDVQSFGRELASRVFKEEDGPALLLKLSEHPQRSVQLFTTNYLERFASDKVGRLELLVPYFTSVLSRVNQGRVAKARVLAFLRREGLANPQAAALVVSVLHRLSATIAIEDRALALEAMVAVGRAHPEVPLPLRVVPVEQRPRAAVPASGGR
ncbi:MAG TPA: hypothetical protein PK141_10040 [Polyangiaceae bacterium]|nr:hypothetical protein [Polyangiaceae bacterium]